MEIPIKITIDKTQNYHVLKTYISVGKPLPKIELTMMINIGANINCNISSEATVLLVASLILMK